MPDKMQTPAGWKVVRLGDVAEVRSGIGFPLNRQGRRNGAYPFIKVSDMTLQGNETYIRNANNYVDEEDANELGANIFTPGTIVIPKFGAAIATNKKRALTTPTIIDNNMVGITVSDTERCDARFLHGWFESIDLAQFANVSAVPSITGSRLKREVVPLPPLPEQRAIAAVLDSIDEAIERTEAAIAATERLRDALLHELLTRGVPGWHTEWKDVPGIGTIPASWEVVRLGEVLESTTYGTNEPLSTRGEMVVLRMNNLQNGEINLSEVRRADLSKKEVHELNLVPGDILFNRTNSLDLVGKVGVVRDLPELISFASYLIRLRTVASHANSFWLSALLWSANCQSRIRKFATPGVSQANINPTSLGSLTIPLPPLPEQEATAKLLDGVDVTLAAARREREGLQLLKESTADALLTGRVRVEVGERIHDQ